MISLSNALSQDAPEAPAVVDVIKAVVVDIESNDTFFVSESNYE